MQQTFYNHIGSRNPAAETTACIRVLFVCDACKICNAYYTHENKVSLVAILGIFGTILAASLFRMNSINPHA